MKQCPMRSAGFTLIELLVVIAIIGVLAGFLATALPKAFERAKIADVENTMNQLRTSLVTYFADDKSSFPPGYGYILPGKDGLLDSNPSVIDPNEINRRHWMAFIGEFNNEDLLDRFSISTDTDNDNIIGLLEYDPQTPVTNTVYNGGAAPENRQRHYIYIPVNKRQADLVYQDWVEANPADPVPVAGSRLETLRFPPPLYDAFVIVSVGPNPVTGTGGLLPADLAELPGNYGPQHTVAQYHIVGIVAYNLLTRDANNNGELDYEFRARTRRGETTYSLPDGNVFGPLILIYP